MRGNDQYHVRAVQCDHRASADEIYAALASASAPLTGAWAKLKRARRIGIKFSGGRPADTAVRYEGRLLELTSEEVVRATLRLLREQTSADLVCLETSVHKKNTDPHPQYVFTFLPVLREFDVPFYDGDDPPHRIVRVPGGGRMFRQYLLPQHAVDVDAFVCVQKMKNHAFMGITLCLKNLFGLTVQEPHGRARQYFHHIIRMPYLLADLGQIIDPALCIVDGLVGVTGREWGGQPRPANVLLAGDQVVATDACAAHLMGYDPAADWPTRPYVRDRNALLVAAEGGLGTVNLQEIDFQSEVPAPVAEFAVVETDPQEVVRAWRRSTCEQALYYRDNQAKFVAQYAGEYILLQDNEVKWHDKVSDLRLSRRELAGARKDSAMWFKLVDPEEAEGEHFEVYEKILSIL